MTLRPIARIAALAALAAATPLFATACSHSPAMGGVSSAQGNPAQTVRGGRRMGELLLSLGLTDEQKSRIRGIEAAARKQNATVTDRAQRRENFKHVYAQIEAVLTPAQRTEFAAKMAAMRKQYQEQAPPPSDHT